MTTYRVGYFVGSLATHSINRTLSKALIRLAPSDLEFFEIPIKDLPLYSYDYDSDYPAEGKALKDAIASADALLFVTPEYNRSIPGALASRTPIRPQEDHPSRTDHLPCVVVCEQTMTSRPGVAAGKLHTPVRVSGLTMRTVSPTRLTTTGRHPSAPSRRSNASRGKPPVDRTHLQHGPRRPCRVRPGRLRGSHARGGAPAAHRPGRPRSRSPRVRRGSPPSPAGGWPRCVVPAHA
ncbi:NADPH-dependent FMN reductase [Streptomyces misionensis]|uniref:NADPH-dependent FMN reductase n=1 Tax=Streptomyces misionensis TaxID=67331 RepID=UPI001C976E3A|nr:NADPH-dependent FMN reductase [Streptomyces misionensis]